MAEDKKLVEAITSMDVDFAQWYTDVCKKAELMSYSSVKGCMIFKPAGYAIWENIKNELDRRFKETGVENVYMPMFIPESLLEREKDHVEGFAPEVAWVTYGGLNPLQERLCVRPTSETLFCDFYKDEIQSYRDLPKVYNQWCSCCKMGKGDKTIPSFKRVLMAGRTYSTCYSRGSRGKNTADAQCICMISVRKFLQYLLSRDVRLIKRSLPVLRLHIQLKHLCMMARHFSQVQATISVMDLQRHLVSSIQIKIIS